MSSSNSKFIFAAIVATSVVSIIGISYLFSSKKKKDSDASASDIKSVDTLVLPTIDLSLLTNKEKDPESYNRECQKVAEALHEFGLCIVRDPRVNTIDNELFLDMMEKYFENSDGKQDARPEYSYQVIFTSINIKEI
jgi:hypothetical protein